MRNVSKRRVVEIAGVFILETYLIGWDIYASDICGECLFVVTFVFINYLTSGLKITQERKSIIIDGVIFMCLFTCIKTKKPRVVHGFWAQ